MGFPINQYTAVMSYLILWSDLNYMGYTSEIKRKGEYKGICLFFQVV